MPTEITDTPDALRLKHFFPAARDRVFRAWTAADEVQEWWGPGAHAAESASIDPRVGGSCRIVTRTDGDEVALGGRYLDLHPPERVVMTWSSQGNERETDAPLLTLTFRETGAATELTLIHDKLPKSRLGDAEAFWKECFELVGEYLGREGRRETTEPYP